MNIRTSNCFELCVLCAIVGDKIVKDALHALFTKIGAPPKNMSTFRIRILTHEKSYQPYVSKKFLNFTSITRNSVKGVSVMDFDTLEEFNESISLNLYRMSPGNDLVLSRATKHVRKHHVNLLQIGTEEFSHYVLIRDFSSFVGKAQKHRREFCPKRHKSYEARKNQISGHTCGEGSSAVFIPPKRKFFEFNRLHMLLKIPWCLYYKFNYMSESQLGPKIISKQVPISYTLALRWARRATPN